MANGRKTLLCVDDESRMRAFYQVLLGFDYDVLTAADARQACEVFASTPVDAVILDYHMPDADGGMVAARIKALNPEVPIILASAYPFVPENAFQYVDAFIPKGESANTLVNRLEGLLAHSA